MFPGLRISASGLMAGNAWMDVIANNIANAQTTRGANGGPYQCKQTVFHASGEAGGVTTTIVTDPQPGGVVHDPGHPDANAEGYVEYPNVDLATEMVDLVQARHAYQMNLAALRASKVMTDEILNLLQG